MNWRDNCRAFIAEIDKQLPADASLADRKRALRENASNFHAGTSWGKQVWSKERRIYLAMHGEVLPPSPSPAGKLSKRISDGDVTFPFRSTS